MKSDIKMIVPTRLFVLATLAVYTAAQNSYQPPGVSPCPHIFTYKQQGTEEGKWYGLINLTTDITLHSLWLNVVLDSKADILGNWLGEVTTKDNIDFKVENIGMKITPGSPVPVRFFVQYNTKNKAPIVKFIRLNGKEICNLGTPQKQNAELTLVRGHLTKSPESVVHKPVNSWQSTIIQTNTTNRPVNNLRTTVRDDINIKTDSTFNSARNKGNVSSKLDTNNEKFGTDVLSDTKAWFDTNRRDTVAEVAPSTKRSPATILYDGLSSLRKYQQKDIDITQNINSAINSQETNPQTTSVKNNHDFIYERPSNTAKLSNSESSLDQYTTTRRTYNNLPLTTSTYSPPDTDFEMDNNNKYDEDQIYEDNAGGIPTIFIPSNLEKGSYDPKKVQCGKVVFKNSYSSENSLEGQFPWQIALYQNQRSGDNKYICGGTLVTRRHIVTAAHCVTRRNSVKLVNKNTLTIYLGKNNLRTSVDGVQIKFVEKLTIHPEYNATTLNKDLAVIELKESVSTTDHVRPICLWPESLVNLSSVISKFGSLVGWSFEVSGVTKQELSLVRMLVVDHESCAKSYSAFFARIISEYSYCATYAEGTSVCNGDSGGGMVFKSEDTWYLRGVVSLAITRENQYRCDPNHFVIFTDVAKFLSWIKNNIYDY